MADIETFGNGWQKKERKKERKKEERKNKQTRNKTRNKTIAYFLGAQVEEKRHSPSKKGLHFTNHREESTDTLLDVDNALQFLKYLLHRKNMDQQHLNLEEM